MASQGNLARPATETTHASMSSSSTDTIELRGARRAMAKAMQNAQQQVAQVTLCEDADIQHWPPHTDTTARLCRAIASGVAAEPYFNAWFDETNMTLTLKPSVDLGIAVDSPHGLFVPVLRNVGELAPIEIRTAINKLREGIETRSTPAQTLQGATFTLSNFGSLVVNKTQPTLPKRLIGRYATPMVVPPCVAILGAGGARPTPVALMGEPSTGIDEQPAYSVAIHRLLPLSLSFDHRVLSGGEAERFLAACIMDLELAI